MKKIFLLVTVTVFSITLACAQVTWVNYKIDNRISVKLPAQPQDVGNSTTLVKDKDSIIYLTILIDFQKVAQADSATLAPYLPTQDFANGLKTGMLSKMPGSTLGEVKIDKWKGYYAYHVDGENAEKKLKLYTYMVVMGSKMYGLMVIAGSDKSTKGKDDFFDSLALN